MGGPVVSVGVTTPQHRADLFLDPATPVEPVRAEFLRFLATRPEWDGRKGALVVTEAFPESVQLRLAMSASTSIKCANLH